jgi:hypothetical protein
LGDPRVAMTMSTEFEDEEPTVREITESLANTLERLRSMEDPCERPTVRMRPLTREQVPNQQDPQ